MDTIKLLKVAATGGTPVELTQRPAWCLDVSADTVEALCFVMGPEDDPQGALIPLAGGEPRPIPGIPAATRMARFDPDGRSITYLSPHQGADVLWILPAQGGEPRRLARFEGSEISDYAWSPDGGRLAVVKVSRSGDVVLLKRSPA